MNLFNLLNASMLDTCEESSNENSLDEIKHFVFAIDKEVDSQTLTKKKSKELSNKASSIRLIRTKNESLTIEEKSYHW